MTYKIDVQSIWELPFKEVKWKGWKCDIEDLIKNGWKITKEFNFYSKSIIIQLREPCTKILGVLKFKEDHWNNLVQQCAFCEIPEVMVFNQEHNIRVKAPKAMLEGCCTESDIPWLLAEILRLQEPKKESIRLSKKRKAMKSKVNAELRLTFALAIPPFALALPRPSCGRSYVINMPHYMLFKQVF